MVLSGPGGIQHRTRFDSIFIAVGMMFDHFDHSAVIKLQTTNIWDIESRVSEIHKIRRWLDELTLWQDDMYRMEPIKPKNSIRVWFKDPQHAVFCKLRWP